MLNEYLLELVEEFRYGMGDMYKRVVDFKEVNKTDMKLLERFSNLLYNVLMIIDW